MIWLMNFIGMALMWYYVLAILGLKTGRHTADGFKQGERVVSCFCKSNFLEEMRKE